MQFNFHYFRRFFSPDARPEQAAEQSRPEPEQTAAAGEAPADLEQLLDNLKEEAARELAQLERDGERDGRLLFVDPAHKLGQIEKKYRGLAAWLDHAYNTRKRREYERSVKEARILKGDLDRLRSDLDQNNPDSRLSRLKRQQETLLAELSEEQGRGFSDEFATRYYQAGQDHFANEQEHLGDLKEELAGTKSWLREEIAAIRNILRGMYQGFGGHKNGASTQQAEEARAFLEQLPLGFEVLERVEKTGNELLEGKSSVIAKQLNAIDAYSKNHRPLLIPKGQIIALYVMSVLILLGECYLVFKFLSKTLGYAETQGNVMPGDEALLSRLVGIFCIAYPLAIGMAFKFRYQDEPDKQGLLKKWAKWGLPAILLSLFLIAFPNAVQITDIEYNKLFDERLGNWIRILCLMVFLTVLTTIFSAVGSLLFTLASDQHRDYLNLTHRPVFGWGQSPQYEAIRSKLGKVEAEITGLQQAYAELLERWLKAESVASAKFKPVDFNAIIGYYLESAQSSYQTGFDRGCSEAYLEKDEAELALLNMRRKIHRNNHSQP